MKENKKISYKNTLIFTIVSAVVSIILIVLLAFASFREYIYFIAIVEVAIFAIIGYCIYRIVTYEKRLEALRNEKSKTVSFSECPDYYIKQFDVKGAPFCSNEYRVKDQHSNEYIMKVYPSSVETPSTIDQSTSIDNAPKYDKFYLNEISSNKNLVTTKEKCGILYSEPTNPNLLQLKGYTEIPWTYMRSRCEGFF
jgi:hypothetical protein